MNKHLIWTISLILMTLIICGTIIYIHYNSWTLKFEMDDNTKTAIESLNLNNLKTYDYEDCHFIQEEREYWCIDNKNYRNEKEE